MEPQRQERQLTPLSENRAARRLKRPMEWGFLLLMVVLCGALSVIRYRWTGELSRAEAARLRAILKEQLRQISRAFNSELSETCREWLPSSAEIDAVGGNAAIVARCQRWGEYKKNGRDRASAFARVGFETADSTGTKRLELNPATKRFQPTPWSESPQNSAEVIEISVSDVPSSDSHRPAGQEWMIFEPDLEYVRHSWLPQLVATWLDPEGEAAYSVALVTVRTPVSVIFSSQPRLRPSGAPPDATAELFTIRGARPGGGAGGNRTENEHRWILEAWSRTGSLDAAVSSARWRNFAVACLIIGLIFGAGCALLSYARRSRRLSEIQLAFVAGVSHDLRTPLTVIRGAGHNLLSGVVRDKEQIERYAGLIVQHADQLADMIEQVLVFAGGRETPAAAAREPVRIGDVLKEALESVTHDLEVASCELDVRIAPDLPPLRADRAALRRAFQNLISNAARHAREGGWIGVSAQPIDADSIEVRVADRGPGIPESDLHRIFEPFFRGERAHRQHIRGAGLGLGVFREIAEAHGGIVTVRSECGHGTEFVVRFPATLPREADAFAHSPD